MALFKRKKRVIRRLLIVEDEPFVAFENEHVLTKAGYEVVATLDHGESAIALIGQEVIDAVILDISLAGACSGIDVARAAAERGVAVLFVSGQFPDGAEGLAFGVLAKPYAGHELISAIEAVETLVQGDSVTSPSSGLTLFDRIVDPVVTGPD